MSELLSLHRYYIWANRFRNLLDHTLTVRGEPTEGDFPMWLVEDPGQFMSYWYAALYVVVEGYRELGFTDERIDWLLASPHVALLHRYRNGVYHFQKNYFDARFVEFMGPPETPKWVRELNSEFGRFFLEKLGQRREPVLPEET